MFSTFHAGFADELTKQAGVRSLVKRIVQGKPLPALGFFEKRQLAKALGVKSKDVVGLLQKRQQNARATPPTAPTVTA